MSFFGSIVDKIVHYASSAFAPAAEAAPATVPATDTVPAPEATQNAAPAAAAAPDAASLQSVDVGAVLTALDQQKGGGLNWQTSIVDLLKLLDLDSSLGARKTLANELGVHAGADGSAEENIALHKAVVQKLAENGGKIPPEMKG
jgi:3-oxoacyl-ACP reductase-like protein